MCNNYCDFRLSLSFTYTTQYLNYFSHFTQYKLLLRFVIPFFMETISNVVQLLFCSFLFLNFATGWGQGKFVQNLVFYVHTTQLQGLPHLSLLWLPTLGTYQSIPTVLPRQWISFINTLEQLRSLVASL